MSALIDITHPAGIDIKILNINKDTNKVATVTLDGGIGFLRSDAAVEEIIRSFALENMPEGFRLMSRQETWDYMCREKFGRTRLAMPNQDKPFFKLEAA